VGVKGDQEDMAAVETAISRPLNTIQKFKATSKNVIPAKAGIQKLLTSLDSRLRGSDKLIINRGSLKILD
jgi:5,10-methylene-tetrahydrofolate dehydrogenase/methenyl tetrahydrofolate cyclohydrolase